MTRPLIIIGAGGHASVLVDVLRLQQQELLAIVSLDRMPKRLVLDEITQYSNDDDILEHDKSEVLLVNGIGSMPEGKARYEIFKKFCSLGYKFETIVAPSAIVSPFAKLGSGVQIMAGAIVQAGAVIGDNTIINTGAIIDHDCVIGANNHIAPGVTLSGQVKTGNHVHIGTGACVINLVSIGESAVVGVGAIISQDLPAGETAYGYRGKSQNEWSN
ncbi:MAG: acetyltransferase [Gammaproteobacteria bacterium]|nr:MAG: acetyltransferase [Gammaproteobacteria bacterium]